MKGRFELQATANDFIFSHVNDRRNDFDFSLGLGAFADHLLEGFVVVRTAIWIAGAVFEDGADIDGVSAEYFGPANGSGKKVRVAEGDVGDGDGGACGGGKREAVFGDGEARIGEGGAAYLGKSVEVDEESLGGGDGVEIGDFLEGAAFAALGALPVGAVEKGEAVWVFGAGDGSGDAGVHPTAEQDDGGGLGVVVG